MERTHGPAPVGRRILAAIIDLVRTFFAGSVIAGPLYLVVALLCLGGCSGDGARIAGEFQLLAWGILLLLMVTYFAAQWSRGSTRGMRMMGLVLVRSDGRPPGLLRAIARTAVVTLVLLPFSVLPFIGTAIGAALLIVISRFRRDRRPPHDVVAGTYMVRVRR